MADVTQRWWQSCFEEEAGSDDLHRFCTTALLANTRIFPTVCHTHRKENRKANNTTKNTFTKIYTNVECSPKFSSPHIFFFFNNWNSNGAGGLLCKTMTSIPLFPQKTLSQIRTELVKTETPSCYELRADAYKQLTKFNASGVTSFWQMRHFANYLLICGDCLHYWQKMQSLKSLKLPCIL